MSKQRIKLTESDLHKIVKEAIAKQLREEEEMSSTLQDLNQAYEILKGVRESGFIPFASPSPSSTEEKVKNSIMNALNDISYAIHLCEKLGYK